VPRIGNLWGACDPANPRNRRRRCAVLIEQFASRGATSILVDTPPDIREQLIAARTDRLDAVLYTHDHADHTHGIDDLRVVAYNMKRRVEIYCDAATGASLESRFEYCFKTPAGSSYQPILNRTEIASGRPFRVGGAGGEIEVLPVAQEHGDITSLAFRIGNLAYSPDVSDLAADAEGMLQGLDVWIVDALRRTSHPSHFSVGEAIAWAKRLAVKRTILTHMTGELDYESLRRELPATVEPAFDGLQIEFA
jgi:phosphoribosyl 1,2-cyclic phosphate phosphodiesterase